MKKLFKKEKKKNSIIVNIITSTILVCFLVLLYILFVPHIILYGGYYKTIDVNSKYKEPGYTASHLLTDYSKKIDIESNVDTSKPGKYTIKYSYLFKNMLISTTRHVKVVDREKPKLKIEEVKKGYVRICPDGSLNNLKYTATDNYDGDITDKVEVNKNDNTIVFTVNDSSNNSTYLIKKYVKEDVTPPTIKLKGKDNITIMEGEEYKEYGVETTDDCDKNVSNKVVINSDLDTKKEGKYEITYTAYDEGMNKSSVKRNVEVISLPKPGTIFLTFDDGPNPGTTDKILDILKEEKVQATFFVTTYGPDSLIKREFDEGHTVALHTASHDYAYIYSSEKNYFKDLEKVQNRVYKITGQKSMIIRFPGGSSNTISYRYKRGIMTTLTKQVHEKGYKYYDWNSMSGDAEPGNHDANEMYRNVLNSISKDQVNYVLLHDIKPYTRDALRDIIRECKKRGYTFAKITEHTPEIHQRVNN